MSTALNSILIMARNLSKSTGFYSNILGFKVVAQSTEQVQLLDPNKFEIVLKRTSNEAFNSKGYTPMLLFQSSVFDFIYSKLEVYGIQIDDQIRRDNDGLRVRLRFFWLKQSNQKHMSFRSPEGIMLGISESLETPRPKEKDIKNISTSADDELKNLLRNIKI